MVKIIMFCFKRNEDMVYYPGKLHKFTIKVDKRLPEGDYQFSLLSESITPWENDPESHNGTAREYLVLEVKCGQYLDELLREKGLKASGDILPLMASR